MTPALIATYDEAVAFLNARIGHGMRPGLERICQVLDLMTDPQDSYPTVHVAGTNGKTTTVWMIEALMEAHQLRVGSYTSPHLESIEDRFRVLGGQFDHAAFAAAVADVAPFIEIYEERTGDSVTYFESTVAIAFQAFAASGVDAAIVEVGLGGRLDATNVLDADVSVLTGIALDHTTILGDSLAEIAAEKAAIVKKAGVLITGPLPAATEGAVTARVAGEGATWHRAGEAFHVGDVVQGVGGWSLSIDGIEGRYPDLWLPLHGRHQVDHFGTAIAATEAFFGHELDQDGVESALSGLRAPGRIEVVGRRPLVLLDGAHNAEGLMGLAEALRAEFPTADRHLVTGFRGPREVAELLESLDGLFDTVYATAAHDPLAADAETVAAAARTAFPKARVEVVTPVAQAVTEALHGADEGDIVVVAGSIYVAGEARMRLRG